MARARATHRNEVLAARGRLKGVVNLRGVLEALDEIRGVLPGEKGVLSGGLDVAAPARIAYDIYDRRPKG